MCGISGKVCCFISFEANCWLLGVTLRLFLLCCLLFVVVWWMLCILICIGVMRRSGLLDGVLVE